MPTTTPVWNRHDDRLAFGWVASIYGGLALAVVLVLACARVAQAGEPPEPDPRQVHMDHYAQLERWEHEFARPRSEELWQAVISRRRESFRNDRARVEYILALRPALRELRTLTQERQDAILAGFCLNQDAADSTVRELMDELLNLAIRMADQAELLEFARTEGALWGRDRRLFRSTVVTRFFEEAARFEAKRDHVTVVVDAMYKLLRITNGQDTACAELYGGLEWSLRSTYWLYEPTLGWPLPP
ncbi:MAG: hypothetical protein AAB413_02355 [Patescibacteria group bacterium]